MRLILLVVFTTCLILAFAAPSASAAPFLSGEQLSTHTEFILLSESAVYNPATQLVDFTIEFNEPPDFYTVDSFGQQASAFQYFIIGDATLSWPENFDSIVRGAEIFTTPGTIPIRSVMPSDPDPMAGGWGTIRGTVSYQLAGNVLTFSVPLQLLSDHSQDGSFAYELETYQFGSLTGHVDGHSVTPFLTAEIDIRPRHAQNLVNPRSRGVISVAILSTPALAALTVDPASVTFGPNGAPVIDRRTRTEDIDQDGDDDLLLYFWMQETGIGCGMTSISLTAQTLTAQTITGTDSIKMVGCPKQ